MFIFPLILGATIDADLRNALADTFGDLMDSAVLVIGTTGMAATLVTYTFPAAAFNAAAAGVCTLNGVPDAADATATGTAAEATLTIGIYQITGLTVGTSGTDVIIDNTSIVSGQTCNLTAFTWTQPNTI